VDNPDIHDAAVAAVRAFSERHLGYCPAHKKAFVEAELYEIVYAAVLWIVQTPHPVPNPSEN
jgi:hypothetical protein